ncbi:MAG TPA: hypothetical protein VMR52_12260, partial [Dehalococcoidia bacterium]|nr:hypothetical protein [Dehalococcoidia bacterium]
MLDGIIESLQPVGAMEYMFVERIALTLWKTRRLERYQAVTARQRVDSTEKDLYERAATYQQFR